MKRFVVFAIAFPLAAMALWLARLTWQERTGVEVRLAVTGFDPRDVLAGHHLTYTVDYGAIEVCPREYSGESRKTCICLTEDASTGLHHGTWAGACEARHDDCQLFLRGDCRYGRFEANIERYYFPEEYRSVLAVVPAKSAITVAVSASGNGIVKGFSVDGVDLVDFAKTQQPVTR
jgi:uncharacterized membrane-anchored protein